MKKGYYIMVLCLFLTQLFETSCSDFNDYLDKSPEAGITEQEVFTKYENFKEYFDNIYVDDIKNAYSLYFSFWSMRFTWDQMTDMSDCGRLISCQTMKQGTMTELVSRFTYDSDRRPILASMYRIIRVCNTTLEKIDMLTDATEGEKADLIAQAYFIRGFAHFTLCKVWGGMPYVAKAIGPYDAWDIPRLSNHDTYVKVATDMDSAIVYYRKAGTMRRDNPTVGGQGHLDNVNMFRPNGVAAYALKGRALLYAASPLSNTGGSEDWKAAAKANWEALQEALENGYFLLSASNYKMNFVGTTYTDEGIWSYTVAAQAYNSGNLTAIQNGVFASNKTTHSGDCPSQNTVDKFETKYGEPLVTDEDRQAAQAAGHYNPQNPYAAGTLDPRFYIDILYNTASIAGYGTAKIYYQMVNGSPVYSDLLDQNYSGITHTGYYNRKLLGDQSVKNKVKVLMSDPIIRLAEVYLNYAEAANEAYGPNTPAPGATMTAVEAIKQIRNRIGMPDVLSKYTGNTEDFRARIKNERTVELCFEGHYYFDIRRWKDAPNCSNGGMMGMDIEKLSKSTATYPTGYKYTRVELPANRQPRWKDAMYYLPFNISDSYKMTLFVPNEYW